MNDYTLITTIGTGTRTRERLPEYQETTYSFGENQTYTSKIFFEAILKTGFRPIRKIIFIGTYTSFWDILIDYTIDSNLWVSVSEEISQKGLYPDSELIPLIKEHLKIRFSVEIEILVHTNIIDSDTTEDIFKIYQSIVPYIKEDSNILFDITHGFRSMPILMYQALQFASNGNTKLHNVELVYGEYIGSISHVRNLSTYWHYARITDAISVAKLDGFVLASLLEKEYSSYSKVINRISGIVQTNFCLQIIDVLKQLKNTLKDNYENPPFWFNDVHSFLDDFWHQIYSEKSEARTIYNFAKYLREKTQSIISLQLAVETACAEKSNNPQENKGDYDFWQGEGKIIRNKIVNKDSDMKKQLQNLESFRNKIAHGGARNKNTKGFPMAENIPNIFDSGSKGVETFLQKAGL